MIRTLLIGCLLFLAGGSAAVAQTIRGRLTTPAGAPVPAGLLTLLDENGRAVRAMVSGPRGEFSFDRGRAGRYSLRVERMGQPAVTGQPFAVQPGQTVRLTLQVEPQPRGLGEVRAGPAACKPGGPSGGATALWQHAALALRISALAEEAGLLRLSGVRYSRRLDSSLFPTDAVIAQEPFSGRTMPFSGPTMPFPDPLPEGASAFGFAGRDSTGTDVLRVPSPAVLLSAGFLETHCFDRVFAEPADPRVGLHFSPVPGLQTVGVEGVLWLDHATGELRTAEYRYRDARGELARGAEGLVAFGQDAGGLPLVSRWRVRAPRPPAPGAGRNAEVVETGALALDAAGRPLDDPDGVLAVLAGVVSIDSLMVAARRAELMPDAPWRWTQGTLDLLGPTEIVRAPQTNAFDAVMAFRPMWLTRRGSQPYCKNPSDLIAKVNCALRQPAVYLDDEPLDGEDVEHMLSTIPMAEVGAMEYIRPIEAFMLFGALRNSANGVILVHGRRY